MSKVEVIDCEICDGTGVVENNKGIESICSTCCGKGLIYVTEKSYNRNSYTENKNKEK